MYPLRDNHQEVCTGIVIVYSLFWRPVKGQGSSLCRRRHLLFTYLFFYHHFYFPAQLVGGFTLSDLLGKPWSQVSSLLPPGTCLQLLSRIGFSIATARRFSSNVANSRSRAFRSSFFYARKSSYEYVHSARIELAKLIFVGTRITYQAIKYWT